MNRRPVTTVIFSGFFLLGMLFIMWGILLPDIAGELAMSKTLSGGFFLLFSLGMMTGAMVGGKYVSRYDFLKLLAVLISADALFLFALSVMPDWKTLFALVFMVGMISATIITIGHTLIARLYQEKRFAMMGVMDFMFSLGTFAASFYVTLLYRYNADWRMTLKLLAACMVVLAVYTFMAAVKQSRISPSPANTGKEVLAYRDILNQPVFILLALVSFGYGAVEFGNANWFVSYAQQGRNFDGEAARNLLACFTAGMVISRLCFAYFLRWFSTHRLTVIMISMTFAGTVGITVSEDFYVIALSNLLLGSGLGGLFPLVLSAAMNIDASKGPVLSGITIIGNSLGVQVASFGTGIWANYAGLKTAFWTIAIAGAWLWVCGWLFSRQLKLRRD